MKDDDTLPRCPDPRCDEVAPLLATAALGGDLAPDEQRLLLAYLTTCGRCRARLEGYAGVAQALALAAPEAEPSPALRGRILEEAARQARPEARPPRPAPARSWRGLLAGALAAAALVLALLLGQQQARAQQQEVQIAQLTAQLERQQQNSARNRALAVAAFGNDDAIEGRFAGGELAPEASGQVFLSPGTPAVVIYARRLPALAEGRAYRVWLQGGGGVRPVGSFRPDPNGRAWAILQPDAALPRPEAIFVTEGPAEGAAQPGGPEVLRAVFP